MKGINFIFLCLCFFYINAQTSFCKLYENGSQLLGYEVHQTGDGGYALFGMTDINGSMDMYLLKTDEFGDTEWTQTYGGSLFEFGLSMQVTSDGGYILCGGYSGIGGDSLGLTRTDANGNELWNKRFSMGTNREVGQHVQQTNDGGFIAVGFSGPDEATNIYIVKTDENGNLQWFKEFANQWSEMASGVCLTPDGGYAISGTSNRNGSQDILLMKINANGDSLWSNTFGVASRKENGYDVALNSMQGFILVGFEYESDGDAILINTNSMGQEIWSQYYGSNAWDEAYDVVANDDGGFSMAGRYQSPSTGKHMAWAIRTNSAGSVVWNQTYPMWLMNDFLSIDKTYDEGFVMFGSAFDTLAGQIHNALFLVKVPWNGVLNTDESILSDDLQIYPNPCSEYVTVNSTTGFAHTCTYRLITQSGQIILEYDDVNIHMLDVSNLASGVYILEMTSAGKLLKSAVLLKN